MCCCLKYRLGLFDNPYWDIKKYDKFGSKEFAAVALQAAEESEVLLKNDAHTLPIAKGKKILLTGPNANSMRCLNGGWSYSWQGHVAENIAQAYIPSTRLCVRNTEKRILSTNRE